MGMVCDTGSTIHLRAEGIWSAAVAHAEVSQYEYEGFEIIQIHLGINDALWAVTVRG